MSKTGNGRKQKTKKQLAESLASLLKTKPLSSLTVREIAENADLNRCTFYLHYKNVYDMVDKLQKETFEKFSSIVDNYVPQKDSRSLTPALVAIYELLQENAKLSLCLLSRNGDAAFVDTLKKVMHEKFFIGSCTVFGITDTTAFSYFYEFVISGCVGIFRTWLENGMKETPEEMAALTRKFILKGLAAVRKI